MHAYCSEPTANETRLHAARNALACIFGLQVARMRGLHACMRGCLSTLTCEHRHELIVCLCKQLQSHLHTEPGLDRVQERALEGGGRALLGHSVTESVEEPLSACDDVIVPFMTRQTTCATQVTDTTMSLPSVAWARHLGPLHGTDAVRTVLQRRRL